MIGLRPICAHGPRRPLILTKPIQPHPSRQRPWMPESVRAMVCVKNVWILLWKIMPELFFVFTPVYATCVRRFLPRVLLRVCRAVFRAVFRTVFLTVFRAVCRADFLVDFRTGCCACFGIQVSAPILSRHWLSRTWNICMGFKRY